MLEMANIGRITGHIPILPAQNSNINTNLIINGSDESMYDGASPVLPTDAATTETARCIS